MSAQPSSIHTENVVVSPTAIFVTDFTEADTDVVRVVSEAAEPAEAVHNCLRIGAKALRAANTAVDVDMVERSFGELQKRLGDEVGGAVERITAAANGLLDDDSGALTVVLTDFRTALEARLGDAFDPDSKSSVVSTIEELSRASSAGRSNRCTRSSTPTAKRARSHSSRR